ncbi:LANO_0D10088g1_1 [Lachancea nothofagi CBS 11611]|uniref:LANO_0D10088g1_1 n=1 Tax=Lachancea nothofagi CBS 11611 TaxID=1266666 RepID=A0A1G4JJX8_9SACH|nr:LANO_0D10088g1_1 [Lachancea nothofagi CBS 11611]
MHNGVGPQTGVDALCLELNRMFYLDPRNNIALTESRPETEQDDNYSAHDEDEPNDNETHETNASNDEAAINEPPMSARPSYPGDCSIDTERLVTQELIRDDPNKLHAQHTGERTLPMLPPASAAPGSLVPFAPDYSDPQIQLLMEQVLTLDRQVADLYARMDDLARNMEHRFAERPVESDLDNESRSSRVTRNSSTTSTAGVAEPASSTAAAAAPATITPAAIIPDMPSLRPSSTIQEPPSLAASRPAASLQMATPGAPIQQHPQLQPLPSAFRPAFPPPVAHMTNPRNSRPPPSRSQPSAGSRPHSRSRNSR